MKIFIKKMNKNMLLGVIFLIFGLAGPFLVFSATTPPLGEAANYTILSSTYTNTVAGTVVNGSIGFSTAPAVAPLGIHTNYGSGAPYATAGIDQGIALVALNSQACTFTTGTINLSTDTTHGTLGVYTPGVYCSSGVMTIGGALTLNGSGTYIFRSDGALNVTTGAIVSLTGGATVNNVFWTPTFTTLAANTVFKGIVIDDSGITVGANTAWVGSALSFGGTVTTDNDNITAATYIPPVSSEHKDGTINVVKIVINDNGGVKKISDFPLFVNGTSVISGETNSFRAPADIYSITETTDPNYTKSFSGDCDINGQLNLSPGENKFCIITNDDIGNPIIIPPIPPIIDVVKVPSPLSLPSGPGSVTYTYKVYNIGKVPVTNITMVGDTCSPIVLKSGDDNNDAKLDVSEVWTYDCTTTLSATHTNTVVTTGWANGLSATDIASATVIVGASIHPPLIHITKSPEPLTLLAGGGMVTYTEKITNPTAGPLSNIRIFDDKCNSTTYISGDNNNDNKLDTNETWIYSCQVNLTKTTTSTTIVSGDANGLTARDFAITTVVVANVSPLLPKTGFPGVNEEIIKFIIISGIGVFSIIAIINRKRTKSNA
ncbi:MAG: ice-binding family protein [Candidatus Paceibacterota bacterium]